MIRRALVFLLFACFVAHATTVQPMTVERLTAASDKVVRVRAVASWSEWNQAGTIIYTYTRFEVLGTLKGAPAHTVVVKRLGGTAGGYTQKVAGVRGWRKGEEAVLFLSRSKESTDAMIVTGLMQGDFRFVPAADGTPMVSNGVQGVEAYDTKSRQVSAYRGSQMRFEDLAARVRQAVTK